MTVTVDEGLLSAANRMAGGRRGAEIHVSEARAQMLEGRELAVRVDTAKMGRTQRELLVYLFVATLASEPNRSVEDITAELRGLAGLPSAADSVAPGLQTGFVNEMIDQLARSHAPVLRHLDRSEFAREVEDLRLTGVTPFGVAPRGVTRVSAALTATLREPGSTTAKRMTRVVWSSKDAVAAIGRSVSPSAASQALQHLERRGLLFRDARGGRTTAVLLSMAGRRVAAEIRGKS